MNLLRRLCLVVLSLAMASSHAHATVIVTVGDLLLQPNSTGLVPVYISTTNDQLLASTSFEFLITTSGPTRLEFTNSVDPSLDPTFSAPNYVFAGNSADQAFDIALGAASITNVPNDTFFGGDLTADSTDVGGPLSGALLAYLPVTTSQTLPPVVGDTFTVALVPISNVGTNEVGGITSFADSSGLIAAFSSSAGTVTIVPEPSAMLLIMLGASLLLYAGPKARSKATFDRSLLL